MRPVEEPTVTTDSYAKSMAAHLPRIPPPIRRRLEYTALIELHLDMPLMQDDQRGADARWIRRSGSADPRSAGGRSPLPASPTSSHRGTANPVVENSLR